MSGRVPSQATNTGGVVEAEGPTRGLWPRVGIVVVALVAVAGLLVAALLPRTLAEGDLDGQPYEVRAAPGVTSPRLEVVLGGRSAGVEAGARARLADTEVVELPADGSQLTVVLGPTPRGVASVRLDSDGGVGEASVRRVLWRRVHFEVFEEGVDVTELVGIGARGEVVEVVRPGA